MSLEQLNQARKLIKSLIKKKLKLEGNLAQKMKN